jgi:hypothetical protein
MSQFGQCSVGFCFLKIYITCIAANIALAPCPLSLANFKYLLLVAETTEEP